MIRLTEFLSSVTLPEKPYKTFSLGVTFSAKIIVAFNFNIVLTLLVSTYIYIYIYIYIYTQ